jgi:hypothetical protein
VASGEGVVDSTFASDAATAVTLVITAAVTLR